MIPEDLEKELKRLKRALCCLQDEILFTDGALAGAAGNYKIGVDSTTGQIYYRDSLGNWQPLAGGGGGAITTLDTTSVNLEGDGSVTPLSAEVNISSTANNGILELGDGLFMPNPIQTGLVYGGIVTWAGTDYVYDVTEAGYYIDGIFYVAPARTVENFNPVVLAAADGTFDRIDTFYVDTTPDIDVLQGIPAAAPTKPLVSSTQIELSFALVETGTTTPTINVEQIYLENLGEPNEWTTTTNAPARINIASLTTPLQGTTSIEATLSVNGDSITFTNDVPFIPTTLNSVITFKLRPKVFTGTAGNKRLELSFRLGAGLSGNTVLLNHGSFGYDATSLTIQTISIPLSTFGLNAVTTVDGFRILNTSPGSNTYGFFIDNIQMQGVPLNPPAAQCCNLQDVTVAGNTTTLGINSLNIVTTADSYFNGVRAGKGNSSVATNTVLGVLAGNAITSAVDTVAIGYNTLKLATTNGWNVGVGSNVMPLLTTGFANTVIGSISGGAMTTANYNTAVGEQSLTLNVSGVQNVSLGYQSLQKTTASYNVGIGSRAGRDTSSGSFNTFLGTDAGLTNTTGESNTFIGYTSDSANTTGSFNTAVGRRALWQSNSSNNTAIGYQAGGAANAGSNVFIGYMAGSAETGSGKLYIDNSANALPLIHGDFTNDHLKINGGFALPYKAITEATTMQVWYYTLHATAGTFTVTLQAASVYREGQLFNIKNTGAGVITLQANGAELIDSSNTQIINSPVNLTIQCTGTGWIII